MAETQYLIAGAARKELDALQHDLYRRVRFNVCTAREASAKYWQRVREIIFEARRPVDPDSIVPIECKFCSKRYGVKLDVREFACSCSPREVQSAFMQRLALV